MYWYHFWFFPLFEFHCLSATSYKKTGKTRICSEVRSSAEQKPKSVILIQFGKKIFWIFLIETACKIVLLCSSDRLCSSSFKLCYWIHNADQNCKGQVSVHANTVIKCYDENLHVYPRPPSPKRCGPTETTEQTAHPQAFTLHSKKHKYMHIYLWFSTRLNSADPTAKPLILFMEIIRPHLPESVLFSAKC